MNKKHLLLSAVLIFTCGCQSMSNTDAGLLGGGAIGAGTGAVVGHALGDTGAGALVGGIAGAALGGLHGSSVDRAEARAEARAVQQIQHQQAVEASRRQRVTTTDVIHMTRNGVPPGIIINEMQTTNAVFDLRPDDIVMLKHQHVDDTVIAEMQRRRGGTQPVVVRPTPVVERRIIHVYEPPPPPVGFSIGFGSRGYHHHHWRRRCW